MIQSNEKVNHVVNPDLLRLLRCPITMQPLKLADDALVEKVNLGISKKEIINISGKIVNQPVESGLVSEDGTYYYPVRNGIPILLTTESISIRSM